MTSMFIIFTIGSLVATVVAQITIWCTRMSHHISQVGNKVFDTYAEASSYAYQMGMKVTVRPLTYNEAKHLLLTKIWGS